MFAAILDTCVLWPSLQRDFILSMAAEGLYRPLWSEAILGELRRHEELKLLGRGVEAKDSQRRADYLIMKMRTNFDDALVTGWEPLEGSYGLRDPNDEHVVAAAVVGGCGRDCHRQLQAHSAGKSARAHQGFAPCRVRSRHCRRRSVEGGVRASHPCRPTTQPPTYTCRNSCSSRKSLCHA